MSTRHLFADTAESARTVCGIVPDALTHVTADRSIVSCPECLKGSSGGAVMTDDDDPQEGIVQRFIDAHEDEMTKDEIDFMWAQCSDADEWHDIERHLIRYRERESGRTPERAEFLADVLVTAVEQGVGHWSRAYNYRWEGVGENYRTLADASVTLVDFEQATEALGVGDDTEPGDWLWLDTAVADNDPRLADITWHVTLDVIEAAFQRLMTDRIKPRPEQGPRLAGAYIYSKMGDLDSEDCDVLLQIATLGEVRY